MANKQFEISKRAFVKKCSAVIALGSLIPAWVFIIMNYFSTIGSQGYYSAPMPMFAMQLACIPIFGYQLPAYLISGLVGISLFKRGRISATAAYLAVGFAGWFVSTLLLFIMNMSLGGPAIQTMQFAAEDGLPSLLLYLWFFYPKPVDRKQ